MNGPAPRAHVCVVAPAGYVHSLGLLDPALYLRHQLQRLDVQVSVGKNRLRHDAVNYVLGAHLGFDPAWAREFACVLVNLEQLGPGGAAVPAQYRRLLAEHEAVDYHPDNVAAYRPACADGRGDVPVIDLGYAPYLDPGHDAVPIEHRPIDLLFIGSVNERRRALIDRIEASGAQVAMFDSPIYGPERDGFIRQAKAVVNLAFYQTARFEQVRAALVLSCGTALVSERRELRSTGERAYQPLVLWFDPDRIEEFFGSYLRSDAFLADAGGSLERFRRYDPLDSVAAMWDRHRDRFARQLDPSIRPDRRPGRLRLALDCARTGYRPGWLNVADAASAVPDWMGDLRRPLELPGEVDSTRWGRFPLLPGGTAQVDLGEVDPRDRTLPVVLGNCLVLLADAGTVVLRWPAGEPRTPLDRLTTRFWEGGPLGHRFRISHVGPLDGRGSPTSPEQAAWLRIVLTKIACGLADRTRARAAREDFALDDGDLAG